MMIMTRVMMMVKMMVNIMKIRAPYCQMGRLTPSHPVSATAPEKVDLINCMNIMIIVMMMMMMMMVKIMLNILMILLMMLMI